MPTKKRRVGFIPRSEVLDLINELSVKCNLSNSKIINILVEEALEKRGIFNKNSEIYNNKDQIYDIKKELDDNLIDLEIYNKFLMFLQFEAKIKKTNL